ncbi:LysE family translocator [Pseudomonas syringae group genomosp. 3]|uniref:Transporter, LysE family n=2 Tax=Pseudomonas syringae group genomosp. 3 TaxID=251701 RepID=Q887R5_PSESM|nr:LysE family translocator [Pseudomonas syringae group genomosp. 3]AAO54748.1 transporter, LysE family [Pseudomonas syringae pv. tomato str. DC3000]KKI27162.1 lysine transporter LysE [Pseudomonas syringae pv. persicae]KPY93895.1 Transporter, LysE family [Pseudomonas syringae pv. tomato]MBF9246916.1 LysE family translocator [Pseudomonas syringae pv. tomato]MBW8023740.1 LysE family translocator [Pseudomonas syringae pv. tomato]
MDLSTLIFFLPACFALNLAPGPNNLLSINNAAHHGFAASCFAGLGRLVAFAIMIALASAGLAAVIFASKTIFITVKLLGAAYLIYLAYKLWVSDGSAMDQKGGELEGKISTLMRREFLVAIGNPKAILIFTAFLPQFVVPDEDVFTQFITLGATFLALEWIAIAIYAYLGLHLQRWLAGVKAKKIFNRVCGSLLGGAGLSLLVARHAGL